MAARRITLCLTIASTQTDKISATSLYSFCQPVTRNVSPFKSNDHSTRGWT